jgi:hypothetical protein
MLLDHFRVRPDISDMEARAMFKIRALPRRIKDLEEMGYGFNRATKSDSTGQRYVRYYFQGKNPSCPSDA